MRFSIRILFAAFVCVALESGAAGKVDTIDVAAGKTVTRNEAYNNYTNVAMTVHGTADFRGVNSLLTYQIAMTNAWQIDSAQRVTVHLAPEDGDQGVINVCNARIGGCLKAYAKDWKQINETIRNNTLVGEGGGGAYAAVNVGTTDAAKEARFYTYDFELSENAATPESEFDLVNIGYNALFYANTVQNHTRKPLVICFTNETGSGTAYGQFQQFWRSSVFCPSEDYSGGDIVLRATPHAPVRLTTWGGTYFNLFGNAPKANLVFEGDGDLLWECGQNYIAINRPNVEYRQTGDLLLTCQKNYAAYLNLQYDNVLPYGPGVGRVRAYNQSGSTKSFYINLCGRSQLLNGLILESGTYAVNGESGVSVLTFGQGDVDGELQGELRGHVQIAKEGGGTLRICDTTVQSLSVLTGRVEVARSTFDTVTAQGASELVFTEGPVKIGVLAVTNATLSLLTFPTLEIGSLQLGDNVTIVSNRLPTTTTNALARITVVTPNVPLVKEGSGFVTCATPDNAQGMPVWVREGTLRFGGETCTNAYWRFTAKRANGDGKTYDVLWGNGSAYNKIFAPLMLGTFCLFGDTGNWSFGTVTKAADDTAAGNLAAGQASASKGWIDWSLDVYKKAYSFAKTDPILKGVTAGDVTRFLSENAAAPSNNWYDVCSASNRRILNDNCGMLYTNNFVKIDPSNPATWVRVVTRLRPEWPRPASYNLRRIGNWSFSEAPNVTDWLLESSPDGVTWETMDERSGEKAYEADEKGSSGLDAMYSFTYGNHIPYLFSAKNATWRFNAFGTVQVDKGATLDLTEIPAENVAIRSVTYDAARGGGMIKRFVPAPNGVLYLQNMGDVQLANRRLPIVLTDVSGGDRLSSWKVYVDGKFSYASRVALSSLERTDDGVFVYYIEVNAYYGMKMIIR